MEGHSIEGDIEMVRAMRERAESERDRLIDDDPTTSLAWGAVEWATADMLRHLEAIRS